MAAKRSPQTGKGLQFSHCTPFPLFQKQTESDSATAIPAGQPHWFEAFEADMKMGEAEAAERLASHKRQTEELYDQAMRGDELAAAVLVEYASTAVQALEQIARSTPERLHQMSMHQIRWPSFIGIKEFQNEKNQELIKKLRLGDESQFRHKWNPKSPATHTAYSMLYWLDENRSILQLPPLSKTSFDQWFETGWQGFSEILQNFPEKHPYLRRLYKTTRLQSSASWSYSTKSLSQNVLKLA